MKKNLLILLTLLLFGMAGCNDLTLGPEPANTPEKNFALLWQEYDRMYGLFEVKGLDWNAVYRQYRPLVTPGMTDEELFGVASRMLGELNDGHVWLLRPGPDYRRYDSGPTYRTDDFKPQVARAYLEEVHEKKGPDGPAVVYGKLPGNIGYLAFNDLALEPSFYRKAMEDVLRNLSGTGGLVVDARSITGGLDRAAKEVAGHFATGRSLYLTTRFRNGPRHSDFTAPIEWYVEPTGKAQYTRPVVLLTNRTTQSAGETFTLAMRQNGQVQQVGDTTYGIFSDNPQRELPNGWIFTVSTGDFRAADGRNYEGIGLVPEVLVQNRKEEVEAGLDKALEKAVELLSR
jgi:hypothetical protein